MSQQHTTGKVYASTGIADLDALLTHATPETLAAVYVGLKLAFINNDLADKLEDALDVRVLGYREGNFPDGLDPVAEVAPTKLWLGLLDRVERCAEETGMDLADEYTESKLSPCMVNHLDAVHGAERRQAVQEALRKAHAAA